METYIYVLCEPDGETVRYVGKTIDVQQRFSDHTKPMRKKRRTHKENWIASLQAQGLTPIMRVIEVVPADGDWTAAEAKWIEYYRSVGANLTNHTNGGEGVPGLRMSDEAKAKMSAVRIGRHFPKLSEAKRGQRKGVKRSEETCRKIGDGHRDKVVSEDARQNISAASIRYNDERRLPDGWTTERFEAYAIEIYQRLGSWQAMDTALKAELGCAPSFYRAKRLLTEAGVWNEPATSSHYRGVSWDKSKRKWSAKIQVNGKTVNIGRFTTEESAALAYNETALRYFGDKAKLNEITLEGSESA